MAGPSIWVVDTNVVVAGVVSTDKDAPTGRILEEMLGGQLRFLLSVELLGEYRAVLARPRIKARHGLSLNEVDRLLYRLAEHGTTVEPSTAKHLSPDDGDQHLWSILEAVERACLVTGDRLLLENCPWPGRVMTPRQWQDHVL